MTTLGAQVDFHKTAKGEKETGPVFGSVPLPDSLPLNGAFTQACPDRRELVEVRKRFERVAAAYEVTVCYMLAANEALGQRNQTIEDLQKEVESLKIALMNARQFAREQGVTMRKFAQIVGVSGTQLSKWTDLEVKRKPDLVD